MNRKQLVTTVLLSALMLMTVAPAWAQESAACQHPTVVYLVEKTGASCEEIVALQAEGVGYGQMMKAAIIADAVGEGGEAWTELLATHQEGLGWGQIMQAQALANADLGIAFDEVVAMMQSGMGWGEIRAELELEPGPPPWAGADHGNGIGNSPGNGNGQGNGNGNGQGNGNSNGNGQGNGNSSGQGNSNDN